MSLILQLRHRLGWLLALCVLCNGAAMAQDDPFAVPAGLEPAVSFWKRIYTEVTTRGGLIHDDERLDVVYRTLDIAESTPPARRVKRIEEEKLRIAAALRRIATQDDDLLSDFDQQIRNAWPRGTPLREFSAAAERVRFQLGQSDRFREGLIRSGAWRDEIRRIFTGLGLPPEIAALPHVESSFNTYAYSRVGAAGMWQFMRSTGKRFLRIDNVVDERLDPYKASVAAANFLQQNYAVLQSWPLAITAYNHGPGGMLRAKNQLGTTDIVTIINEYDGKTFGFASRNFYACFLAALQIDRDPQRYFPELVIPPRDDSKVVKLDKYVAMPALVKSMKVDSATLKQLNPSLLAPVWTGSKRIPAGFELRVPSQAGGQPAVQQALNTLPAAAKASTQVADTRHRVRRGETLSTIAQRYEVSTSALAKLNGLRKPYHVRIDQVLKLPTPPGAAMVASAAPAPQLLPPEVGVQAAEEAAEDEKGQPGTTLASENAEPKSEGEAEALSPTLLPGVEATASADPADYSVAAGGTIRVEAAETLGHYADWLEISPARLRTLNKLKGASMVSIGRSLKLDFSRVTSEKFSARRGAYHKQLQDAFFAQYRIVGSDRHVLKKGESVWVLSQKTYNIPVWLLRQYNPDLNLGEVHPGTKLVIPRVKPISATTGEEDPA